MLRVARGLAAVGLVALAAGLHHMPGATPDRTEEAPGRAGEASRVVERASRDAGQVADGLPIVLPVDEAAREPAFFAFRARLERAIARRDTAGLLAAVHPEIGLSFGPDPGGSEAFRAEWLEGAGDIWAELGAVLALGGRFQNDSTFVAPYTFTDAPDDVDPFQALIALDEAVPVFAAPGSGPDTLAVLSFQTVRHEWRPSVASAPAGWVAVRLPDGSLGFVESDAVRSPLDYRAIFTRTGGRWWMTVFIAGD